MLPIHINTARELLSSRIRPSSFPAKLRFWAVPRPAGCRPQSGAIAVIAVVLLMTVSTPFADSRTAAANAFDAVELDDSIAASIAEASQRSGIPASWLRAVISVESGGDPLAVSPRGARV